MLAGKELLTYRRTPMLSSSGSSSLRKLLDPEKLRYYNLVTSETTHPTTQHITGGPVSLTPAYIACH
jgi:hypothetical protein